MRFTVGGEEYDLTKERVVSAMRHVASEPIHKHLVEIEGTVFPPKQVFAAVTGRPRTSFTTMEAQRVLGRLGFVNRRAGHLEGGRPAWVADEVDEGGVAAQDRVAALEAALGTLQAAVAGLHDRVSQLEAAR